MTKLDIAAIELSETERAENETAVRALLQQLNASWGNADVFGNFFTEDADYVMFDGSHAYGRNEIVEVHRPLFEGILKGSRLVEVGMPTHVRFVAPEVAIIHSGGAVLQKNEKKPGQRAISVQTLVAVKRDGHWLFAAFQNTRYRPFAQTLLGKFLIRRQGKSA